MARKILSVDDSASIRQMVSFTLKKEGYDVIEAVDGNDALAKIKGASIDLVITDLHMPNLDGIGLIRALRAESTYRFTPIVMLTTESHAEKKDAGKRRTRKS